MLSPKKLRAIVAGAGGGPVDGARHGGLRPALTGASSRVEPADGGRLPLDSPGPEEPRPALDEQAPVKVIRDVGWDLIKDAGLEYLGSGGTSCVFPFPAERVGPGSGGLLQRPQPGRVELDLGRATGRRSLTPGVVYNLTCWRTGDRITGPFGATTSGTGSRRAGTSPTPGSTRGPTT